MTRVSPAILDSGDPFPALTAATVAHGRVALPEHWEQWGVLLVYRGHW